MEYKIDKYHQIKYTTTDGKIATPTISSWEVVNKVISNEYKNGTGWITFEREVKSIPTTFFMGCKNLKSIILPPKCKVVHDHAFYQCANLEEVKLNDGLRMIQEYAFSETGLKTVEIPSSCFDISTFAFWSAKMEKVKFNAPTTTYRYIGAYAFKQWHNIEGISEYDDFNSLAFGVPEK